MKASSWGYKLILALMLAFIPQARSGSFVPADITPPAPTREYRAAWIATVANIDWPSTNSLTPAQQRAELLAILDRAASLKLNALIFQVRPGCDAMYASQIEPWSEYLTGAMGKAPSPVYDPLRFAVDEAHKRGIELHAWFNPYRARHARAKSPVASNHISKTRPQLVKKYGPSLWLDPGEKEVQDYSLNVVMDVLRRYDVDGIHFDDYFYPYKEEAPNGGELEFPDEESWRKSGMQGKMNRDDWRRQNVNVFIERVYKAIKAEKPWVKFGISPFGIWKPGNPPQIKGFDQYDKLYADARKWLQMGWCDYFAPQLYWPIDPPDQSFPVLLKWWAEQNPKGRHLTPGMNSVKVPGSWKPEEIERQILITRKQSGTGGHIHWNMKSLMRSGTFQSALLQEVYGEPALPPRASWLSTKSPASPVPQVAGNPGRELRWRAAGTEPVSLWLVQLSRGGKWSAHVLPGKARSFGLPEGVDAMAVSAVDRFGATSKAAGLRKK